MDRASEYGVLGCFRGMPDEEIVLRAKHGSDQATEHLLSKYKSLVEGKARSYFLAGADHEDVVQEGMIGLYKAIRDFRTDKQSQLPGVRGVVRDPADNHRGEDGDQAEARPAEPVYIASRHAGR